MEPDPEVIKCDCCELHQAVKEGKCEKCWRQIRVLIGYTNIYKEPSS